MRPKIVYLTTHDISGAFAANELLKVSDCQGIFIQNSSRPGFRKILNRLNGINDLPLFLMGIWSLCGFQVGIRGHLNRTIEGIKEKLGLLKFHDRRNYFIGPDLPEWRENIPIHCVNNINDNEIVMAIKDLNPDLLVVVGGRILKKPIISIPRLGCVNLHTGILPWYRGCDSEFWALYNNELDKVGITIHYIDEGLDTGDIILQERLALSKEDTLETIHWKNIEFGARKLAEIVALIPKGQVQRRPQDAGVAKHYKPPTTDQRQELASRLKVRLC